MLGQSFAPLGNDPQQRPQGGIGGSPIQEAIRTLSLRVPRWTGGGTAPAPQALLQSPGMGGMPGMSGTENPIMQALMRMIQGGFGGGMPSMMSQGGPQMPGGMPLPPPKVQFAERPAPDVDPNPQTPPRFDKDKPVRPGKFGGAPGF